MHSRKLFPDASARFVGVATAVSLTCVGTLAGCGGEEVRTTSEGAAGARGGALVGRWVPTSARGVGEDFPFERAEIDFRSTSDWEASDACNDVEGVYRLDEDGEFDGGPAPDSFDGRTECAPGSVDYYELFEDATRVEVSGSSATFFDGDGSQILVLARS